MHAFNFLIFCNSRGLKRWISLKIRIMTIILSFTTTAFQWRFGRGISTSMNSSHYWHCAIPSWRKTKMVGCVLTKILCPLTIKYVLASLVIKLGCCYIMYIYVYLYYVNTKAWLWVGGGSCLIYHPDQ